MAIKDIRVVRTIKEGQRIYASRVLAMWQLRPMSRAPIGAGGVAWRCRTSVSPTRRARRAAAAWQAFEARLTFWQKHTLLPRVRATMRQLKRRYVWREQVRSDITRVMSALRVWHLTLADRFVDRG